jgi:hypothetical protein
MSSASAVLIFNWKSWRNIIRHQCLSQNEPLLFALTPLIPLSKHEITDFIHCSVWRGGRKMRGGFAPSRYALPFLSTDKLDIKQ